eukprot:s1895_g15.t1
MLLQSSEACLGQSSSSVKGFSQALGLAGSEDPGMWKSSAGELCQASHCLKSSELRSFESLVEGGWGFEILLSNCFGLKAGEWGAWHSMAIRPEAETMSPPQSSHSVVGIGSYSPLALPSCAPRL